MCSSSLDTLSILDRSAHPGQPSRFGRRRRRRRRRRLRLAIAVIVLGLSSPAVYSYTTTMMQPSSLPLWPRSVEWLRAHHGNWLVDEVEHYYYSWKAPEKGGPQLTGASDGRGRRAADRRDGAVTHHSGAAPRITDRPPPPRIKPVFATSTRLAKACGAGTGPVVRGRPPVLVTTFRTETRLPADRCLRGLVRPHPDIRSRSIRAGTSRRTRRCGGRCQCPPDQRWRLLATFNGGFIYSDGQNGSSIGGQAVRAAERRASRRSSPTATAVSISKTWTGGPVAGRGIAFARQSLPLIVDHGRLNPP